MMRFSDSSHAPSLGKQQLEVNPSHPIIRKLFEMKGSDEPRAKLVAEQVFDNALAAAGLLDDARTMVPRLNKLLEFAMKQ
jgi:HSP90 family molecular chaperone